MFGGVSGAAVDGKPSRFFSDGSTTMTSLEAEPWWQASKPVGWLSEVVRGRRVGKGSEATQDSSLGTNMRRRDKGFLSAPA